jgi:chromosomal replication initiator protein
MCIIHSPGRKSRLCFSFPKAMSDQYSFDDRPELSALRGHWDQAMKALGETLPATIMGKFIQQLEPTGLENGTATFTASSVFIQEWVKDKYLELISKELSAAAGRRLKLVIKVSLKDRQRTFEDEPVEVATHKPAPQPGVLTFQPNPQQAFDTFVTGSNNRMAKAGAEAVAEFPGKRFNPLFIYSKSGLGKTHLLHAIANEILRKQPQLGVVYMTGQKFTEDYVAAVQTGKVEGFRRAIRNTGVWLLDDVQFVIGKEKTQEEVFHAFNSLQDSGRQIVVCSDRPPRDLLGTHERLRSRFEMGLVVDMQLPDTETRAAIISQKAKQEGALLSPAVCLSIAEIVVGNVRHLEGALNRVLAYAQMEGVEPDTVLVREVCAKYYKSLGPVKPTFQQIVEAVSRQFRVDPGEVLGTSRKAPIALARHVAVYVAREILGESWKHIGASFGDKDHTTMMHGYKKIREQMDRDRDLTAAINGLMNDLYPEN